MEDKEASRRSALSASVVVAAVLIITATFLWMRQVTLTAALGGEVFWLTMAAIAGALGALFSLIGRTGKLKFDLKAGRPRHYLATTRYILEGVFCGLVVTTDIRIEVILSPLPADMKPLGALIIAGLSGAIFEQLARVFK